LRQEPPALPELGAPGACAELAMRAHGLVLVSGPTGSGKSSTLAAMVRLINETRPVHILTSKIRSNTCTRLSRPGQPARNRHPRGRLRAALRAALREDPDVLLVGELRDTETIRLALTAAETGHLVLATLHAASAARAVDRIIDAFAEGEKDTARALLAEALQGVIAQSCCRPPTAPRAWPPMRCWWPRRLCAT
jgi:twitching motility protein PilT